MKNVTILIALTFTMLLVTSCSYRRLAATTTPYENDDVYYQPGDTYISDYAIVDDPEAQVDSLNTADDYYDPNSASQNNTGYNNNNYYNACSPYNGFGYNNFNSNIYNSYGPSLVAIWDPVYGWHFSYNINYGWGYNPYWNNASCYSNPWYNPYYCSGWNSNYWWNSPYYYSNPWYYNYNNYWGGNNNYDTGTWFGQSTSGAEFVNIHRPGFSTGTAVNSTYTGGSLYVHRNQVTKKPVVAVDRTTGKPMLAGSTSSPSSAQSGRTDGKTGFNNNSRANANTKVPAVKGTDSNSRNSGISIGGGRETSKPASTPSTNTRPANTSRPAPSSPAPSSPAPSRSGGSGTPSPRKHQPQANNSGPAPSSQQQVQESTRPVETKKEGSAKSGSNQPVSKHQQQANNSSPVPSSQMQVKESTKPVETKKEGSAKSGSNQPVSAPAQTPGVSSARPAGSQASGKPVQGRK